MGDTTLAGKKSGDTVAASEDGACWRFGDITFDERTLELKLRGDLRPLSPKPLELLMLLLRRPGEVVTKEELFAAVWPRRIVSEASLTNAISRLRLAIGDEQQQIIKSTHGHGYRLMGTVVRETPLPTPVAAPVFSFLAGEAVPLRPDWRFDSKIGAGGQGEVWLATHLSTREKRVFKFARDETSLIGLKREVTLFRLLRENLGTRRDLVQLLDWNLDKAPWFIAVEWCPGGSLTDWAASSGGLEKIELAQRIELVAQTADALAATHAIGALHKDVKPGNVLIAFDDEGRLHVRLADFGSARLLQRSHRTTPEVTRMGFTQTIGDSATGTPLYLAPELIAGEPPSPQSDIYALGVMLYQLVVGNLRRPLAPGWESNVPDELLREDIALAAAGDPAQRLDDAAQLAVRLRSLPQRHVDRARELRLKAEAESTREALQRSLARRGLLRALAVTLILGLGATSVLLWQALKAKNEARDEAARANAVTQFLSEDLLTGANPVVAGRRDVTVRELLDGAVRQLDARFDGQPRTRASLQRVIGSAYAAMGERAPAEALLQASIASLSSLDGDASLPVQTARTALRDMYLNLGEFGLSTLTSSKIVAAEAAAGRPNPAIATENEAYVALGMCAGAAISEFVARCENVARDQYARVRQVLGAESLGTARIGVVAAVVLMRPGRSAEAIPILRDSLEGMRHWMGADNAWLIQAEGVLPEALAGAGRYAEALEGFLRVDELGLRVYGPNHRLTRVNRRWIATTRVQMGERERGTADLIALYDVMRADAGTGARDMATVSLAAGDALNAQRRPAEAAAAFEVGLSAVGPVEAGGGYWTLRLREGLADSRQALGQDAAALALHRQNLADARRLMTNGEWLLGWCAHRLGAFLAAHGQMAEAEPLRAEARKILEASLEADDPRVLEARASRP
ncbi:protein kinase domain-containing protein [Panacagrimonas perspica]|nr:winged helix-turn-helix domain-containing protein [Panacagrimonas perspica]